MITFNEERAAKSPAKYSKELKLTIDIIGSDGEPVQVTLGYMALFDNNDVLSAIADMSQEGVKGLASKLKLSVQDAGLRQERAKRTITFA